MQSSDKLRVIAFYERELERFGPNDPRALAWVGAHTQNVRFQVLYEVGPWQSVSVADIGCGLGDFCSFLATRGHGSSSVRYHGYDIAPRMIEEARQKHPKACFLLRDIQQEGLAQSYDYVVASGTFNVRIAGHEQYFRSMIAAMYQACTRAVAFNFLGPPFYTSAGRDTMYFDADPAEVEAYCRTLCPQVVRRDGYLSSDYTVYMYKDSRYAPDSGAKQGG